MDIFLWTLIATVWDANGSRDFIWQAYPYYSKVVESHGSLFQTKGCRTKELKILVDWKITQLKFLKFDIFSLKCSHFSIMG